MRRRIAALRPGQNLLECNAWYKLKMEFQGPDKCVEGNFEAARRCRVHGRLRGVLGRAPACGASAIEFAHEGGEHPRDPSLAHQKEAIGRPVAVGLREGVIEQGRPPQDHEVGRPQVRLHLA